MGLLHVELTTRRADPVAAEIWVSATVDLVTPTTELRGRIVGPRCQGRATIEVAYPLRAMSSSAAATVLTARVVIPEPSLWQPEHPFVYDAVIELWQDGRCLEHRRIAGYRLQTVSRPLS